MDDTLEMEVVLVIHDFHCLFGTVSQFPIFYLMPNWKNKPIINYEMSVNKVRKFKDRERPPGPPKRCPRPRGPHGRVIFINPGLSIL